MGVKDNIIIDERVQPLYVTESVEKLEELAKAKIPKMNVKGLLNRLDKLHIKIKSFKDLGDQEKEFIYLYRYFQLASEMEKLESYQKKDIEYQKQKTKLSVCANRNEKHFNRLDSLYKQLEKRYNEVKENQQPKEFAKPLDVTPEQKQNELSKKDTHEVNGTIDASSIDCSSLYSIILKYKNSSNRVLLLLDIRSAEDFKTSHITYLNQLNIPSSLIERGMSADKLASKLESPSHLWNDRSLFEKIVLLDWRSKICDLSADSKISILRDIMTNWDPGTKYKSLVILDGGFEEVHSRYPIILSNPQVRPPSPGTDSSSNIDIKNIYEDLLVMIEERKGESVEAEEQPLPSINRALKPSYSNVKGLMEAKKSEQESESTSDGGALKADTRADAEVLKEDPAPGPPLTQPPEPEGQFTETKEKFVANLRKLKPSLPDTSKSVSQQPHDLFEEVIHYSQLKGEGGGSKLKRCSSTPNIAQIDDGTSLKPTYSRCNKPVIIDKPCPQVIGTSFLDERTDATYGKTILGLTGLKNFANNCYMNSILQCLSNTEDLVKELTHLNKPPLNPNSSTKGVIANQLITVLRGMWSGEIKVYSIKDLKDIMGYYQEIFRGSKHQDCHEFLIILLEYLHDDLNIAGEVSTLAGAEVESGERAWGEFRKKNCSVIQRLFYGQDQSAVTCAKCSHTSTTFGQFFNLVVPIPDNEKATLEECIQLYMSGERVTGWHCPECKASKNAIKKMDITRLPPILIIALKRFSQEGQSSWLEKKENLVTYPLEGLDMSRFTVVGSEQRYSKYNLHAVSLHSGTLRSGHYRAICRNRTNNNWYVFDDTLIYSISPQEVKNNPEVYILFYHAVK